MALQVWLPLINDLHNQGLASATVSGGSKQTSGGKLGAGHYKVYNGAGLTVAHTIADTTEFTFTYWLNIPSSITSVGAWNTFMNIPAKHNDTSAAMCVSWASYNQMKWYDSTGYDQKLWQSFSYDTWYHIAVVHSSGILKIYINGELGSRDYTMSQTIKLTAGTITIGGGMNATNAKLGLQDFRIYNHALSAEEVKHISQGLVAHYTLGSASLASSGNLINGLQGGGQCTISGNSVSISGTNSDTYFYIKTTKAMTSGKLYRLSCIGSGFPSNAVYNFPIASQSNTGPGQIQVKNGPCMLTFVANDTCANAGTQIIMDDLTRTSGAGTISGLCLEEISSIADSSGYSRNLTITGNVSPADSVRYDKSLKFNGSSYLSCTSPTAEAKTLSLWAYIGSAIPTSSQIMFADYKSKLGLGFYNSGTQIITRCSGTSATVGAVTLVKLNSWNHFCVVNGSSNTLYINGTAASMSGSNNWTHDTDTLMIGMRSVGSGFTDKISDVRLYATALSADDVKELYNLGASIS